MAKQSRSTLPAQSEATVEGQELVVPTALTPAAIIGTNTKLEIAQELLPEEFQGQKLEVLDTGFAPTVKWVNPGNFIAGVYTGFETEVGPNKANLYNFEAKGRMDEKAREFGVWGTTVLDRAMMKALDNGMLKPGYLVCITYLGGVPTDFQDAKMFNIQVVKK